MIKCLSRLIVALTVFSLICTGAKAQIIKPGVALGLNAIYSMPQGDFKNAFKYGVGGEVYGGVGWGKTFLLATVGYRSFKRDATIGSVSSNTLSYIPVKLGIKQLLFLKRIFLQADAGVASVKYGGVSESAFTAGGGAGVRLAGLELGLYYDAFKMKNAPSYSNSLNAKLGYSFTL